MDKSRVVIIVLVVIAIVYFVGIGVGSRQDNENKNKKTDQEKGNLSKEVPGFFKNLRNLLPLPEEKLKGSDFISPKFSKAPIVFEIPSNASISAEIGEGKSESRPATFKLSVGQVATVKYRPAKVPKSNNEKESIAEIEKPRKLDQECPNGDKNCFKITIFKSGGTVGLMCLMGPCRIELLEN